MDGCNWLPFQGAGIGSVTTSERSCGSGLHQEQDMAISSQVEQQLEQICMLMDTEDHGHTALVPSSPSLTLRTFSRGPDENMSLMLTAASTNTTTNSCHHSAEVSSLPAPLSTVTYGDHHDQSYLYDNTDMIPNLDDFMGQEAHQEQAQRKNGHNGAFRPYCRHLNPKKKPKPGSSGQRAIKAAMTALARIHMARLAQWQRYQMETMAAAPSVGSNCNQLQHVLSERKRREKLNDSFMALRTVLPPAPKKDKASILIRARDYVNILKSRVSELEERNRMLVESQEHHKDGGDQDNDSGELIEVDISKAAAEKTLQQEFHLNIAVRSGCNAMDDLVRILQCLKDIGDVSIVVMDKGSGSGLSPGKTIQKATSSRCDDDFLKESIIDC